MAEGTDSQDEREALLAEIAQLRERLSGLEATQTTMERYRALVQSAAQWIWSVNIRGNWGREADEWWEQVTGQTIDDAHGWGWLDAVYPDDREPLRQRWSELLDHPSVFQHEYRLHMRNGEYRWHASLGVPLKNPDGSVREWIGMLTDIHARRAAEEELRILERALMTSPVGFVFADLEGCLTKINPAFLRMFGYERQEEVIGRYIYEFSADKSKWPETRATILQNGSLEGERVGVCKDGALVPVNVVAALVHDPQGRPQRMMASFIDLTGQKQLSEQLQHAQKLESIGRLAGGVAHDFNNLLTAILGFAELAESTLADDAPQHHYVANIRKAAERAADLTQQLLAFARKQPVEPRIVSLNEIIAEDEKILRRLIREDIEFMMHLEPEPWKVKIDPGQITQILVNLAVNAHDAISEGGRLTITTANMTLEAAEAHRLTEDVSGDYILLQVGDTGVGMTEEVQAHLFEPFYTTKPPGKGTGLGLATVYGIVKQNSGYIQVQSAPHEGTVFSIYLPRVSEAATPAAPAEVHVGKYDE